MIRSIVARGSHSGGAAMMACDGGRRMVEVEVDSMKNTEKYMPKRIILVRHGESEGNEDEEVLEYVPNYKIKLSNKGIQQAENVGSKIKKVISENGESENWKVLFYVSPSERTKADT
ncbi:Phosphoglycerate mutase-like protein AT74 [Abeliophyllum distichum]|uniref:Phosphoglycerate mutase-like protein AT74 n=1 Tax=Abeliophyllum distichum TaxID=126358 RepID=A0ABD1P451_9LAMI